jgi:hypothetical protein
MSENTLAIDTGSTDGSADQTQSQAKTYTQQEFDDHMARMKGSLQKKLLKPYEELGDPETLRNIVQDYQNKQIEDQKKRGEFDNILKELANKKDQEIQRRDAIIAEYKVDVPLTNAAAKYRSVNPEQVRALLKSNVRMNSEGEVEIVDSKGQPRYRDSGDPYQVDDLVREFLDSNPHFVQPTPATSGSRNSIDAQGGGQIDLSKLDMKNPEHRAIYAKHKGKPVR